MEIFTKFVSLIKLLTFTEFDQIANFLWPRDDGKTAVSIVLICWNTLYQAEYYGIWLPGKWRPWAKNRPRAWQFRTFVKDLARIKNQGKRNQPRINWKRLHETNDGSEIFHDNCPGAVSEINITPDALLQKRN